MAPSIRFENVRYHLICVKVIQIGTAILNLAIGYGSGCYLARSALYQHRLGCDKIDLVGPSVTFFRCNISLTS
jgi:hypothetical protein